MRPFPSFRVAVSFSELHNLELFKRGLYRLQLLVHDERGTVLLPSSCRTYAGNLTSTSRAAGEVATSDGGAEPGFLDGEEGTYTTRTCHLRFSDEVFDVAECVEYVSAGPVQRLRLSVRLMLSDCRVEESGSSRRLRTSEPRSQHGLVLDDGVVRRVVHRTSPWTEVSKREVALTLRAGMHACTPIVFDSLSLACTTLSVHCALQGRHFRQSAPPPRPALAGGAETAETTRLVAASALAGGGGSAALSWFSTQIANFMSSSKPSSVQVRRASDAFADESGMVPPAALAFFNECHRAYAAPQSLAEALFPRWLALRVADRRAWLESLFAELCIAATEGDLGRMEQAMASASSLVDASSPRAMETWGGTAAAVTGAEANAAHSAWLQPLVDECVRLAHATRVLTGGSDALAPLQPLHLHPAGSSCAARFGPRTRHAPFHPPPVPLHLDGASLEYAEGLTRVLRGVGGVTYGASGHPSAEEGMATIATSPMLADALSCTGSKEGAVCFALRAASALAHAVTTTIAIEHERAILEARLAAEWRALHGGLARQRLRADALLQAQYRESAAKGVEVALTHRERGLDSLSGALAELLEDGLAPTSVPAPPPVDLLDPVLSSFSASVRACVTTYGGTRTAATAPANGRLQTLGVGREWEGGDWSPDSPIIVTPSAEEAVPSSPLSPARFTQRLTASTAALAAGAQADDIDAFTLARCPEASGRVHAVVFVNGMGGSVHDLRRVRAALRTHEPHLLLLSTGVNQGAASEGDIVAAGVRMALDVDRQLEERARDDSLTIVALSIVAFSLGGVVARVALRHPSLARYRATYRAFITIASPHLGLLFAPAVFSSGVYLLQQVRTSVALGQLALTDTVAPPPSVAGQVPPPQPGLPDTVLYLLATGGWAGGEGAGAAASLRAAKLSDEPNGALLARFQHVVLLGSPQDGYSPYHSCLAGMSKATIPGYGPQGAAFAAMVAGFWSGLGKGGVAPVVTRVSVAFPAVGTTLSSRLTVDAVLGRQAHVAFLETDALAAFIALGPPFRELWDSE